MKKSYESRDIGGLKITIPLLLKQTKTNKAIFWGLCEELSNCGILRERYVNTIALCSNSLYDYHYYSEQLESGKSKGGIIDEDGKPSVYLGLRNNAETRYLKYVDKLGLTPRSSLSLKLSDEEEGELPYEKILD